MNKWLKVLKPGDKITCIKSCLDKTYIKGKIYTVKKINNGHVYTTLDEFGSDENGWYLEFFEPTYIKEFENRLEKLIND